MAFVELEKRGPVAWVTINRPDRMNALGREVNQGLRQAWLDFEADPELRVAVLTGAGDRAFCAGADLKEAAARGGEGGMGGGQPAGSSPGPSVSMTTKPVIAAINGYCLAGGLELADACDLRIASENAEFGCPEVKWNLLHGYGAIRMAHSIPHAYAMQLLMTGEFIDAPEALKFGLVSKVVPQSQLVAKAQSMAEIIASRAPLAIRATKQLFYASLNMPLNQALTYYSPVTRLNSLSSDTKEGPLAFSEKRTPQFQGR
ncbi:MAG TPA: enoyl-CoA hydratase-related protein [Dehalococcoidia bacterium]|nr:enoyl-CoA hydratase-related protein [Dehalococcoidia bacterium]